MQQTYQDNSCWISYINGVEPVIGIVQNTKPAIGSDTSLILGWLYYFEVMARFSLRHWRTEQMKVCIKELGFDAQDARSECMQQWVFAQASFARGLPQIAEHSHPLMRLLAEVSDTAMYSSDPKYLSSEYQQHLDELRMNLGMVSSQVTGLHGLPDEERHHMEKMLELNRLAGLIYLERVSRNFSGSSAQINTWTTRALLILTSLETCFAPFAIFIVSCELANDRDRIMILDIFARAEKKPHLRSFLEIRALIQTAWNQQDLAGEEGMEYIYKLTLVMSSRNVIPSLI
jgi:hypothetical protein